MELKFGKLAAKTAAYLLRLVKTKYVDKIEDEEIRRPLQLVFAPGHDCLQVLGDKDPNDKAQIKAVVHDFLAGKEIRSYGDAKFQMLLSKLKSEDVRLGLQSITPPVFEILAIIGDGQNDAMQVEAIYKNWLNAGGLDNLVLPLLKSLLEKKGLDEDLINFVLLLVDEATDQIKV